MEDAIVSIALSELGATPKRVEGLDVGLAHETYELRCDGVKYVLQFAGDDEEGPLRRGHHCYRLLQDADVPVPDVVTDRVQEYDGRPYVLVERLPGTSGERDISPERVRNAGRCLARIHDAVRFDAPGQLRFDGQDVSTTGFDEGGFAPHLRRRVADRAQLLRDGGLESVGSRVERVFDRVEDAFPTEVEPVLCHDDYSPDNVLFADGEVTGVLDFDYAYAGHDQRDLVKAANGFWMHDPTAEWDVRSTFYDAYRAERNLEDSFERNEPLYRAETHAGTVASLLERGELSEYEQEFYAEAILAALDRIDVTGR